MVILRKASILLLLVYLNASYGCREVVVPKPKGHFRIDLPKRQYLLFNDHRGKSGDMPFSFEYPAYGNLSFQDENRTEPGWFNIEFPTYKAKIYLTYKDVRNDFENLMEQTYKMNVKNHITKADAINEQVFNDKENNVYGILYDLKGNTASAVQFYVTDSVHHYLRGSLYFSAEPNADSLAPVIDFFREDIIHLIETLKWNN
ncbi:MAG: gliding motility lipoprotein GldD [Bacteroidia bacterium]|nr:gliding motility lipoprotein GldD [Bacteroidia bacterium]